MTYHQEESDGKNPPDADYGNEDFVRVLLPEELALQLADLFRGAGFPAVAPQELAVITPLGGGRAAIMLAAGEEMNPVEATAADTGHEDLTALSKSAISIGNHCYLSGRYKCCVWFSGSNSKRICWIPN